jgi:sugar/nucleoside kinase (ribokinase family)
MNFWIEGEPQALKQVISRVDLVVINEAEARELTREASLLKAAQRIQAWGPQIVIVKRGEYGALLFYKEEIFSAPGLPLETVKDPTGAGDSFAGGVMGYLAREKDVGPETLKQAVIIGSVIASFNVEDFSCRRLKRLTPQEISERIGQFKTLSHFEEIKI